MTEPLPDPDAPTEHTLPSGLKVTVASHRTLRRPDIHKVWAAVTDSDLFKAQTHDALAGILATVAGKPLSGEDLDMLRPDDYLRVYTLMEPAYRLITGQSVLPNPDDHDDPKAPSGESNATAPDSKASPSNDGSTPNGTSSPTPITNGSPQPTAGPTPR